MNNKRLINVRDHIRATDQLGLGGLRGEIIFGKGRHKVPFTDPFGKQTYRMEFDEIYDKDHNIVPIGGYQLVFDKLFNIGLDQETPLRIGDLNDESPQMKIGVQRANYRSINYNAETSISDPSLVVNSGINISAMNFIFGFMMGDGGSKEDNITVITPNYTSRSLFRAVPFRMTNDGNPIPEGQYFGKATTIEGTSGMTPVTSYYVKKFSDPKPRIVHCWVDAKGNETSIVDDTVFASTSSDKIESYVEINIDVDQFDGRGFFTSTGATPRVNEFALVSGWYNAVEGDYESIRIFSKMTRPSITLDTGDHIEAIYRIYAR